MNEIMSLLSSIGTVPLLGMGGVVIALVGYSGFKAVKKHKRMKYRKLRAKKFDVKSNITNEAYKANDAHEQNFDPETYTVNTEDYTANPKRVSGAILRPRADNIEAFLKEDLPLSGSASHDTQMRQTLVEQKNSSTDEQHESIFSSQSSKHLIANSESRYFINKALDADKNKNKSKAIENINLALEKEPHPSEKLRFSTILKNYSSRNETLLSLFIEYPSFLAAEEELEHQNKAHDDESDFEKAKAEAQKNHSEDFSYKELASSPVDRFSHLDSNLAAPKMTFSQHEKTLPNIMARPLELPHVSADKSFASDINELPIHEVHEDISNIFQNISQLQSTTHIKDDEMATQNAQFAEQFNDLLKDHPQSESFTPPERKPLVNKFAYDIWVQWMTTANGKTSFKSSMYKLTNPWTSRKAILELSEKISEESKNSDGSKAAWSVISVQPFFDI